MKKRTALLLLLVGIGLASAACSDDPANTTPDGGTVQQDASMAVCDPSAGPANVQLSNAAVPAGTDVVQKTPRHPGPPGPNGLP